jgi:putative addiction module component (TIGR02574 family)
MTTQPIIEGFRKLSPSEKIRLLQQLWDEIAGEAASMPLNEPHRRLLDQRLQQHEADPGAVEPWDTVRDDILDEL